eukprot:TRINITY_DN11028_c0_g1_i2.p1 TRINITY_DN11028_c0_g1~~TRINITY_DN11028_c0_g1_i2.p1  ORF type:complete len:1233 (+),score=98.94 TRINITY_DN11028_c0_g1_i2:54-3701(+)
MVRMGTLAYIVALATTPAVGRLLTANCPSSAPVGAAPCPGTPGTPMECDDEGYCCWDAGTSTCFANEVEPFAGLACDDATWFATAGCTCSTVIEGAVVSIVDGPLGSEEGDELSCPSCGAAGVDANFEAIQDLPTRALQLTSAGPMTIADAALAISMVVFSPFRPRLAATATECAHPYRVQYNFGLARFVPELGNHFYQTQVPMGDPSLTCGDAAYPHRVGCSWSGAQNWCAHPDRDLLGLVGYLPTWTSRRERDMIQMQVGGIGWVGRTDAAREGEWRWVTGPEGCPWSYGATASGWQRFHRSGCRLNLAPKFNDPCFGADCGKGSLVGVQPPTYLPGSFVTAPYQQPWLPNTNAPFNAQDADYAILRNPQEKERRHGSSNTSMPMFKCEWGGVGTLCMELAAVSQTVTLVINTTACPDVDECVTGCNTCHNTECNGLTPQQACFDPNHDAASLRDWECRCNAAGFTGSLVGGEAVCTTDNYYDECDETCFGCENDLCSNNTQDCVDPYPSTGDVGDWECRCGAHASAYTAQTANLSACVYDECAVGLGVTCNDAGMPQNCTDGDNTTLGDWVCSCANGATATAAPVDFANCSATPSPATPFPGTPSPATPSPATPSPATSAPATSSPATPVPPPPTPSPATLSPLAVSPAPMPEPLPQTALPPTLSPATPSPAASVSGSAASASVSAVSDVSTTTLVALTSVGTAVTPPKSTGGVSAKEREKLEDLGVLASVGGGGQLGVFRALGCSVDDVDLGLDEPLDFEFSPTGIALADSKMRYLLGAVVVNSFIMAGCTAVVLAVAAFVPLAGADASMTRRLAALRAPGMLMIPFMLLLPGTCLAAARLLFSGEAATYMYVVAALGLALCCVSPYFLYRTVVSHVKDMAYLTDDPRCAARDASTSDNAGHRQQKPLTGWMLSVYRFAFGEQIWVSRGGDSYFADKMGYVFDSYRAGQEHMVLVEVMLSVALCFLAAFRPQGGAMCHLRNSVISLMFVAWLAAVVVQRPFLAPLQNYWTQVIAALNAIALVTITVGIAANAGPDGFQVEVTGFCLFWSAILTIGKGVYDMMSYTVDFVLKRRAGAWEAARENECEDYDVELEATKEIDLLEDTILSRLTESTHCRSLLQSPTSPVRDGPPLLTLESPAQTRSLCAGIRAPALSPMTLPRRMSSVRSRSHDPSSVTRPRSVTSLRGVAVSGRSRFSGHSRDVGVPIEAFIR